MDKKFIAIKNSTIGLLSQITTFVFSFITRQIFIQYIGMELLGINGTFASLLNALSLSEMGVESAVIYCLYSPIHENDTKKINDTINILKIIYRFIGTIFILGSILLLPILKYILVDIKISEKTLYIFFLLQAGASSCSYFFAYKRTLLYANQKGYIFKIIDMSVSLVFNIMQCIILVLIQSYPAYLLLKIAQTFIINILTHIYSSRYYPYLHHDKINKNIFNKIIKHTQNIFVGKFAGFIYSSSDNIIISTFVNTISVAFYGNYTTIVFSLKNLTNGFLNPIAPIIGNYLVEEKNNFNLERTFLLYTHIRFLTSLALIIPIIILIDDFITIWVGAEYILSSSITYLLAADFYIHLVHSATIDYINGMGLFKIDKYIELVGACANFILSFLFVHIFGIAGVILGTVLSQCLFWVGRSVVTYFYAMHTNIKKFYFYWLRNIYYCIIFITCTSVCQLIYSGIKWKVSISKLILGGILCEICIVIFVLITLSGTHEQQKIYNIIKKILFQSQIHKKS